MEIYVQSSSDFGNKRYTWSERTGTICRAPVGMFFDPAPTKIGSARSLEHAISVIKSYHGGSNIEVEVKGR